MGNVALADILPGFITDHSLITLNISLHSNPRDRGFWKLNTSLLSDTDYIDMIKLTIEQTKEEYKNGTSVNPSLLWEMIKMKAREKSISYAIGKKRNVVDKEHILEEKLRHLEKELPLPKVTTRYENIVIEQLELCRNELEDLLSGALKGRF